MLSNKKQKSNLNKSIKTPFYQIESKDNILEISIIKSIPNKEAWDYFTKYICQIHNRLTERQVEYYLLFDIKKQEISKTHYYKELVKIFENNDAYLKGVYFICPNKVVQKTIELIIKLVKKHKPIYFIPSRDTLKV